jgi:predicted AAA+ superfamily ATPase
LGEITFPRELYRTIKYYIDIGELKNDILILYGSLSMELKKKLKLFLEEGEMEKILFYCHFLLKNL